MELTVKDNCFFHRKEFQVSVPINSLAPGPGRSEFDSKNVIFNLVLLIGIFKYSHDNALWWMPQDLTDDKSTLVQVMAWCHQATSHYLSQFWPRSLSPYGVTRPQWAGWETSARPLANASENLAGRVENRPGRVEFCIGYIRDYPVRASTKKF